MIAPQRHRRRACVQDGSDMPLDPRRNLCDIGIIEGHVAVIHDRQQRQGVIAPAIGGVIGLQHRRLADGTGTKARAGPVRHRLVERDAGDRHVRPGQILGIVPPQKACRPAERILERQAARVFPGKGLIDLIFRIFQCHRDLSRPYDPAWWRSAGRAASAADLICIRACPRLLRLSWVTSARDMK